MPFLFYHVTTLCEGSSDMEGSGGGCRAQLFEALTPLAMDHALGFPIRAFLLGAVIHVAVTHAMFRTFD